MQFSVVSLLLILSLQKAGRSQNVTDFWKGLYTYRNCFYQKNPGVCLKERALDALNETIFDDRPMILGVFEIQRNPDYFINETQYDELPVAEQERSLRLGDVLMDKIEEFFKSRTVKLNLSNAFEGRKGGGGGGGGKKGGNTAMMVMVGMGAMMVNMVMGKMAMMAGSALMIAKISLVLSMIMLAKKMQEKGGGGGEEKHIVYADSGHSHGGGGYGGGGGWHRSLEDPHNIIYKGQWTASSDNGSDDDGFFYFRKTTKTW